MFKIQETTMPDIPDRICENMCHRFQSGPETKLVGIKSSNLDMIKDYRVLTQDAP